MLPDLSSPADIAAALPYLTPEERKELDFLLTKDMPLWMPQIGPQMQALESPADIIFFGGSAGGGKTDLMLGAALTRQEHSIIFRREAVQLVGMEERMTRILRTREGYNSQSGLWRLPGGRILEFGSVKEPDDWIKYQGRPHDLKCVARGTPVLMADRTHKVIEKVQVGDMVMTLQGPRVVTRTIQNPPGPSIRLRIGGFVQYQSLTHKVLTPQGWIAPSEAFEDDDKGLLRGRVRLTRGEPGATFPHPYREGETCVASEGLETRLLSWVRMKGKVDLFDLTVKDANHYITGPGIINKNCFDEITHFLESQFRVLIGWMRTDNPKIRQRVICAGNPPTTSEGEWVIRYWAPWLDPLHPNPAKPGELRWYVVDEDGQDKEVPGPEPVMVGKDLMTPKSRTFIRSSVDDNLYLTSTGYKATLQALPEPLRSQMLRGDFGAGRSDPAWQLMPTDWIKAAQARWVERENKGPMTCMGLDIARGGKDSTVAARRHGSWFDRLVSAPGVVTTDGPKATAFAVPLLRNRAPVAIDAIGVGGAALDFLVQLGVSCIPVVGSNGSHLTDKSAQLRFRNKRAEMYWLMREALDPTADDPIALPPDPELLVELAAVRYKVISNGRHAAIVVRDKDDIKEVIGRSPDKADAVAMTFVSDVPLPGVTGDYDENEREAPDWR
jgi:hypothetical protein